MKLIVDSGSTKADWVFVHSNGEQTLTHTMGFNPYFHTPEMMLSELSRPDYEAAVPRALVQTIHYYGAGCSDQQFCDVIFAGLKLSFPNASEIYVEHDLLGAARATCGYQAGIAGILGTGSNSCLYDGANVVDNITALSHVIGDEGSGVHLGKLLLQAYYYRELPKDLEAAFEAAYPEGKRAIIHRVYGEHQNVRIAEFAQFLMKHKAHPKAKELIQQSFSEFAQRHLKKYAGHQQLPINLVGSVADVLKVELEEVLRNNALTLGTIIRRPIDKLVEFHG